MYMIRHQRLKSGVTVYGWWEETAEMALTSHSLGVWRRERDDFHSPRTAVVELEKTKHDSVQASEECQRRQNRSDFNIIVVVKENKEKIVISWGVSNLFK